MSRRTFAIGSPLFATVLALAMTGCGKGPTEQAVRSPREEQATAEIAELPQGEILIWLYWFGGPSDFAVIYVDDTGSGFHYSDVGREDASLIVYRDVRLSDATLKRLLSVKHAGNYSPGFDGSETVMRSCVICAHETNVSVYQCVVRNSDLFEQFRELESALEASEGRTVDLLAEYDQLPLNRELFPEDVSGVVDSWDLKEIRPSWIAAAWERAGPEQ